MDPATQELAEKSHKPSKKKHRHGASAKGGGKKKKKRRKGPATTDIHKLYEESVQSPKVFIAEFNPTPCVSSTPCQYSFTPRPAYVTLMSPLFIELSTISFFLSFGKYRLSFPRSLLGHNFYPSFKVQTFTRIQTASICLLILDKSCLI